MSFCVICLIEVVHTSIINFWIILPLLLTKCSVWSQSEHTPCADVANLLLRNTIWVPKQEIFKTILQSDSNNEMITYCIWYFKFLVIWSFYIINTWLTKIFCLSLFDKDTVRGLKMNNIICNERTEIMFNPFRGKALFLLLKCSHDWKTP